MMKSERVKLLAKDGFSFSKPIGMVEVYFDDGTSMKIEDVIMEVLSLRKDLTDLRNDFTQALDHIYGRFDVLKNIDLNELRIVIVSLADRLTQLEDETDII